MAVGSADLAAAITKVASKQTYYTIRFLVDRPRIADAFRAYAYFRWVDDVLDAVAPSGSRLGTIDSLSRTNFLRRQTSLLDRCVRGESPRDFGPHEAMLVELIGSESVDRGLAMYLRNMMRVMDFDTRRRGRLVTKVELTDYTRWLATAVTEAMHYFIGGGGCAAPDDGTRYMAATGAHILHMLRDTYADVQVGYYNIPREVLHEHSIGPQEIDSDAYRAWVGDRVQLARACFDAGRAYLRRVPSLRHRLAAFAYIGRFEWLTRTLEADKFMLRPYYSEGRRYATRLLAARDVALWTSGLRRPGPPSRKSATSWAGRA